MRPIRILAAGFAATLLILVALVVAAWLWTGGNTSLAFALNKVASYLPAGQTLEARQVTGSLRGGGSIGWLRWQRGELSVEAHDVTVGWSMRPLLDRKFDLGQITVKRLHVDDRRAPSEPTPPTDLRLPIQIQAPFQIDAFELTGTHALLIENIAGNYKFDRQDHELVIEKVRISSGTYQLNARLQAQAPMALSMQLQGAVDTAVPSSGLKVTVKATAQVQGHLSGPDAALDLQGQLTPEFKDPRAKAMKASVTAHLRPWQTQPVEQAQAQWQALDLAALWPQAPQTLLTGNATVAPAGTGWRAQVKLSNALAGPWDKRRLPVNDLSTQVIALDGRWAIESLQASAGGGRITGQGQFVGATANWQGSGTATGINPAAIDSRLESASLDGQFTAKQTSAGIAFDVQMQPTAGKAPSMNPGAVYGLRLKTLLAKGLWRQPIVELSTLEIQTPEAKLQGQIAFDTVSRATEGKLALTLPGAQVSLNGQMASTNGHGDINLRVIDAAQSTRWLARLPGVPASLTQTPIKGDAEITGQWQGGWQHQGQDLQINATLRARQLDIGRPDQTTKEPAWRLRDIQGDLLGAMRALTLNVQTRAESGTLTGNLKVQAKAGQVGEGHWQAQLNAAQLSVQDTGRPGIWTLQLTDPVRAEWKQRGASQSVTTSAGTLRLSGPAPGAATVKWMPASWNQQGAGATQRTAWTSKGSVQDLPLAWLALLGRAQMNNLGLRGDLMFGGQWDAAGGETLHLRATLERTSGDLQLLGDNAQAGTLSAGVRDARLVITTEGDKLAASLRWDSERAGQAQADVSTRLRQLNGAWSWPLDAPLAGSLHAQLPPVGAWSLLAPPGWRLKGTLDTDASLSGTRGAPQWRGTLRARDLAVRSAVDGIDFSNGTLLASLDGQRLDINEFTLLGAGGDKGGGQISIKGFALWLPPTGANATVASRLRMELDADIKSVRLSARADRRLAMSGNLTARLDNAKLAVRGNLKVDQALFILPDDSAPQLGDDVIVRRAGAVQSNTSAVAPAPGMQVTPDIAITMDLGSNFQIQGRGLKTRLEGKLELRSTQAKNFQPRLTGELRTVRGSYRAYDQNLDIEEGVLRFYGPYDNPALDILAIRPNLQQRVGVQISGTALSPVVRLYAEPDLPDAEKLAWLVLGRSPAGGGAEAAVLQQAALALLGGNGKTMSGSLKEALGIDELSLRGAANNADGSTTSATITVGKRISRDFYVAYERSLTGTLGTFYIFYDLSRRFTLRAQTGEQSAVDLIFTIRYD